MRKQWLLIGFLTASSLLTSSCSKKSTESDATTGTVTDIDNNIYKTVKIGSQWWMAENMKVTRYRNGEAIPNVTDSAAWAGLTTGAHCNYDNNASNVATYGRLYNWYAVGDSRNMAPAGWHVASDAEWKQLGMFLGMTQAEANSDGQCGTDEGGKMKETGTVHWLSPNTGATNESGFSALPSGDREGVGFSWIGGEAHFWCSTLSDNSSASWDFILSSSEAAVFRNRDGWSRGCSVRCVKD